MEVKMKKIFKTIGILSVVVMMTAAAFAQPRGRNMIRPGNQFAQQGRMNRPGSRMAMRSPMRMLLVLKARQAELKITDAQLDKIENLMYSFQENQIKVQSEANLQRLELQKLFQDKGNRDYAKIKSLMTKSSAIRQNMAIERMKHRDEVLNVLTPEQQQAVKADIMQRFQGNRMFMRGGRGFSRMGNRGGFSMREGFHQFPMKRNRWIR
jgi:Spy/CpxP family protein refolding chaperone